uniref:Reverse transcriptase domain-containing protein n=1 Tax=Triticum urartu TaxID=4572 RepID=A0A8R7TYQ7_TRIUA
MEKAYDRVGREYLRQMMQKLDFAELWISRVMACVQSASFSVRVNGVFSETFKPSRGIRQGNMVSPYLFLICAEGLTSLLKCIDTGYLSRGIRCGHPFSVDFPPSFRR